MKPPIAGREHRMSFEKMIKQEQDFRLAIKEMVNLISALTNDELELTIARLADMLCCVESDEEKAHIGLKAALVKAYFDLRLSERRGLNIIRRTYLRTKKREFFIKRGIENHTQAVSVYRDEIDKYKFDLCKWKAMTDNDISQLRREFVQRPKKPKRPSLRITFIIREIDKGTFSEFLVSSAATFRLIPALGGEFKVSQSEILELLS